MNIDFCYYLKDNDDSLTGDDVREGIVLIVSSLDNRRSLVGPLYFPPHTHKKKINK